MQVFCDFSGYSDIARGAAQVMGFQIINNFNRPFLAQSVAEFWKRWHISLSLWFRDYIYFPLAHKFHSKFSLYLITIFVFLLSGLWHGADWKFIIYGFLHGFFIVFSHRTLHVRKKIIGSLFPLRFKYGVILWKRLCVFILFSFSLIFFRAQSVKDAFLIIQNIFSLDLFLRSSYNDIFLGKPSFWMYIVVLSIIFLLILQGREDDFRYNMKKMNFVQRWTVYYILVFGILFFGIFNSDQFIYFQF